MEYGKLSELELATLIEEGDEGALKYAEGLSVSSTPPVTNGFKDLPAAANGPIRNVTPTRTRKDSRPVLPTVERTPEHGKGKLRTGNPRGPTPNVLREAARERLDRVQYIVEDIASGAIPAPPKDRVAAVKVLADIGIPKQQETTVVDADVQQRLAETIATIERLVPMPLREQLIKALDAVWT